MRCSYTRGFSCSKSAARRSNSKLDRVERVKTADWLSERVRLGQHKTTPLGGAEPPAGIAGPAWKEAFMARPGCLLLGQLHFSGPIRALLPPPRRG
jgi:hypothetical protein